MLFWFSYSWCLIQLQLNVMLFLVSSDSCQFLILLVRQTARCSPSLKTRKMQLLINTTFFLLCCRVLWFNNLQHRACLAAFLRSSLTYGSFSDLEGRCGVCACENSLREWQRLHSLQISTSFVATCTISQWGKVLLFKSFGAWAWFKLKLLCSSPACSILLHFWSENFAVEAVYSKSCQRS